MGKKGDLRGLKFRYYKTMNSIRGKKKGDLRAFVGAKTWSREQERLKAGEDKYSAHISALEESLTDLEKALENNQFSKELKRAEEEWRKRGESLPREGGGEPIVAPPIPTMKDWQENGLTLISLFSGALGLDLGFLARGFDLRFANDTDKNSWQTVTQNMPSVPFAHDDFGDVDNGKMLKEAGLKKGEVDVLTGGPPCQPFSTAGKREGLNDPRSSPLRYFVKAIKEVRPRAFVMEEVTGLESARLKHVPISERDRELEPEEKKGSAFEVILKMLESTGYNFTYEKLNAADYGSPQKRKRLIFIGLRDGGSKLPDPTHADSAQHKLDRGSPKPWNSFWEATIDLQGGDPEFMSLSSQRKEYMRLVPPAGHWRHLPESRIEEAMGGAYSSGGGKMGYFRRLSWDEPSPTVVTSPHQKSTMLCHPELPRPLSVEEYKRVQGFPDDWELAGSTRDKYKLVGDAVPVHISYSIARKVEELLKK